jgi:hypothetical protein
MKALSLYITITIIMIVMVSSISTAQFAGGDGTPENPYQIETVEQLQAMKDHLDKHFILMNDIDASATVEWNGGEGFEPVGEFALGDSTREFRGSLSGNDFVIRGLTINRPFQNQVGLIGYLSGSGNITDLGLENVNITGRFGVGALVGHSRTTGTISDCFAGGTITGQRDIGGLVGGNLSIGKIENSYTIGTVNGRDYQFGGLVGINFGTIINSYSSCAVSGLKRFDSISGRNVGGLAGFNSGVIQNCYAVGNIEAYDEIGGLIGYNSGYDSTAIIQYSYAVGSIYAHGTDVGGLVGVNDGAAVLNSFWNVETTGRQESAGGNGKSMAEMLVTDTFMDWDFSEEGTWMIYEGITYPYHRWQGEAGNHNVHPPQQLIVDPGNQRAVLSWQMPIANIHTGYIVYRNGDRITIDSLITSENYTDEGLENHALYEYTVTAVYALNDHPLESLPSNSVTTVPYTEFAGGNGSESEPYLIETAEQLYNIRFDLSAHYKLLAEIDLGVQPWNLGDGWMPIGEIEDPFTGSLNGNGYKITGLRIVREDDDYIGLFGSLYGGGTLHRVILTDVFIVGGNDVGGLVGYASFYSRLDSCHVNGSVTGNNGTGGLVGSNWGLITRSSSESIVTGYRSVGGLIGNQNASGLVEQSYFKGSVNGDRSVGGLVGAVYGFGGGDMIRDCYAIADIEATDFLGGVLGWNDSGTLVKNYFAGTIDGSVDIGGLVGGGNGQIGVTSSYWNTQVSGQVNSRGGVGLSTNQMIRRAAYIDWDFDDVWAIVEGTTYPYLRDNMQEPPPAPVITYVNDLTGIPTEYSLFQNYPNPFNPSTVIRFGLPEDADVRLVVYDMLGRQVAVPVGERKHAGYHEIGFDAGQLAGGMYVYRLRAGEKVFTKKMLLIK